MHSSLAEQVEAAKALIEEFQDLTMALQVNYILAELEGFANRFPHADRYSWKTQGWPRAYLWRVCRILIDLGYRVELALEECLDGETREFIHLRWREVAHA